MSLPVGMSIRQTVVTLTAATDTTLVAANSTRKYLAIVNIGTSRASLAFGATATAVADSGWPLSAASIAGDQGGGITFEASCVTKQAVHAISTVGTTVVVLEGV